MIDPSTYESRQDRLLSGLDGNCVVIVSRGSDIRWLTGFTGSNGLIVLGRSGSVLLTDGRYEEQADDEAAVADVLIVQGTLFKEVPAVAPRVITGAARENSGLPDAATVLYQADDLTVELAERLRSVLDDTRLEPLGDRLAALRCSKDAAELDIIRHALALSEKVMSEIIDVLRPGVSEREVAAEIDYRHRLAGADGQAFDTIVAFGSRASLPHARPGDERLESGECILLDFGCVVDGYRSDITRTMILGSAPEGFIEAYDAVKRALQAASDVVHADMDGRDLDGVARDSLRQDGLDGYFAHSLGHGVGLDIHEGPRVSSAVSSHIPAGAVITLEPGVYLRDRFGVRIENMVSVDSSGGRVLNSLDTSLVKL